MPENSASVASTGGLPSIDTPPASPPERSRPRSARMPSIRRPYRSRSSTPRRRWPKNQPSGLGASKRVRLSTPTSTAASVTRASSPAAMPVSLTGTFSMDADFTFSGSSRPTWIVLRRLIDGEPAQPERTARHALGLLIHRPVQQHRDVGAGAPVVGDADRHLAAAGRQIDLLRCGQARVQHGDQRPAAAARGHLHARRLADLIGRLVERDVQRLGAVGAFVGLVAGIEDGAGDQRPSHRTRSPPGDSGPSRGASRSAPACRQRRRPCRPPRAGSASPTRSSSCRRGCTTASAGRGAAPPISGPWPRWPCRPRPA